MRAANAHRFNPEALRELRYAAGWTQAELAGRAGVSATAVSLLENGRTSDPHTSTLSRLAQVFRVELSVLLEDSLYEQHLTKVRRREDRRRSDVRRRAEEERRKKVEEANRLMPAIAGELQRLGVSGSMVAQSFSNGHVGVEGRGGFLASAPPDELLAILREVRRASTPSGTAARLRRTLNRRIYGL